MKRVFGLLCCFLLAQGVGGLFLWGTVRFGAVSSDETTLGLACSLCLSNLLVLLFLWRTRWITHADLGTFRLPWRYYAASLLLMLPAIFLVNLLSEMLSLEDVNGEVLRRLMFHPLGVLTVCLLAPLTEEVLFRAGVQGCLQRSRPRALWPVCLSAALFALVHGNPAQMPAAFLLGWLLGAVYALTGSLWPAVAAHAMNNLLGVLSVHLFPQESTFSSLLGDEGTRMAAIAVAWVWLLGAAFYCWHLLKQAAA